MYLYNITTGLENPCYSLCDYGFTHFILNHLMSGMVSGQDINIYAYIPLRITFPLNI